MITALDTSVLLDVFTNDPSHVASSRTLLQEAYDDGHLIICDVVYAELAPNFESQRELDLKLSDLQIQYLGSTPEVAWLAGQKWKHYRKSGGPRTRLLADFLSGAHAQTCAGRLLTRDRGFYRNYFAELEILEP